ncbi:LRR receptor-like serine/threonine-protein kinase EFR [Durio zibethinus]|uniref:LRR receptor-like serine/threonine-protein kinase EFR n=1 Tax=Durio zibethinus TaxID=66656 RepID=A0A6P5WQB2_DURZI|nr:LRR receptor-like serine/threonine-protein kinase EFR [Durio zibethinus]
MICLIPTPNLMGKIGFLFPLMVLLLLPPFGATLSAGSPNISTDQLALLVLKSHVTYDPRNFLASNWSTSASVCNWIGVTCGSRHQRVTALNFSAMSLTGTIPPHLGNLSFLAWLDIHNNSFQGSLPIELANLRRLKYLNFANNSFSGEFPSWFGSFTQLQSLYLDGNNFTGVIPSTLGNLSKLEILILDYNNLKGPIPAAVGNLSNLKWLILDENYLSGCNWIPFSIFNVFIHCRMLILELIISLQVIYGREYLITFLNYEY